MIEDDLLKIGFNFMHFTENDATLSFNLRFSEDAVLDDVRQDLYRPVMTRHQSITHADNNK